MSTNLNLAFGKHLTHIVALVLFSRGMQHIVSFESRKRHNLIREVIMYTTNLKRQVISKIFQAQNFGQFLCVCIGGGSLVKENHFSQIHQSPKNGPMSKEHIFYVLYVVIQQNK